MPEDISLEDLVLGYCLQAGGLVEPPAYGIYEVLLPDEVAERINIAPHQLFTFDPEDSREGVTYLHYGHPLVDAIANELRWQSANGIFFINSVRPEKPGLYAAAEKAFSLPNARLFPVPDAAEQVRLHHYVRFNFKVSLIADEKRELILPVWMDLQSGYPVNGAEIERLAPLDTENQIPVMMPAAPALWTREPPLAPKTLSALLERARKAVPGALGDTLAHLEKRLARYLELDRARLEEYYSDLLKDAERRLQKTEMDRRPALEAKIAAISAEREAKLADVEQKYHLHIQLELINLAVIVLPKVDLVVEVRKRTAAVKRTFTWNPLLHVFEPLACDVCGQAGAALQLCENGHLAHVECLAPQCVDCKRTYCQICAHELQDCVVCERPVCVHSMVRCPACGRVTCQEHINECHADNGQPRKVVVVTEHLSAKPQAVGTNCESQGSAPETEPAVKPAQKQKLHQKREAPRAKTAFQKSAPRKPLADYLEVFSDPARGTVTAYAMHKKREVAVRWWALTDEGIAVSCNCEKSPTCREDGLVYYPFDNIEQQINSFVDQFQAEYMVPRNKVRYFQIRQDQPFDEKKLKVPSSWKNPEAIERARMGFDLLKRR